MNLCRFTVYVQFCQQLYEWTVINQVKLGHQRHRPKTNASILKSPLHEMQ